MTRVIVVTSAPPASTGETASSPDDSVTVALIGAAKDLLSAAAWPIAIIIVVLLLKNEISKLLGSIKHIKFKDFEASVEQEIEETLSDEASNFTVDAEQKTGTTVDQIVGRGPIDAILSAWIRVETAIWELYRTAIDKDARRPGPVSRMIHELMNEGVIDPSIRSSIRELQIVRNRTVHELDNSVSATSLTIYVQSALRVEAQLRDKLETLLRPVPPS